MCDYSLRVVASRPAKVGDKLISTSFPQTATRGFASIDDVKALLEPRARKLAGAIAGRALYDGRLDPTAALALIRTARAAA